MGQKWCCWLTFWTDSAYEDQKNYKQDLLVKQKTKEGLWKWGEKGGREDIFKLLLLTHFVGENVG